MKNFYIIIFSVFCLSIYSQVPFSNAEKREIDKIKYIANYNLIYRLDSAMKNDEAKKEEMVLLLGEKTSLFQSESNFINDTTPPNPNENQEKMFGRIMKTATLRYKIYKHYSENRLEFIENLFINIFRYEEKLDQIKWEILEETMMINDMECQKATCNFGGREYTAWFSLDIPINDGPYKFVNLPGLIVDIYDSKNNYRFSLTSFSAVKSDLKMYIYNESVIVDGTKEELYSSKKRLMTMRNPNQIKRGEGKKGGGKKQNKGAKNSDMGKEEEMKERKNNAQLLEFINPIELPNE